MPIVLILTLSTALFVASKGNRIQCAYDFRDAARKKMLALAQPVGWAEPAKPNITAPAILINPRFERAVVVGLFSPTYRTFFWPYKRK